MIQDYQLKNYFSTVTSNFTSFQFVDEDMYYCTYSVNIDNKKYTCMRHGDEVRIFNNVIPVDYYYEIEPLIKFEL